MNKRNMPLEPEWLDSQTRARPVGVDRERKVVRGYIVAEQGYFKSEGRGQFTTKSLDKIVSLYREHPAGLKARFSHPTMSSDGIGTYLGRSKDAYRDGPRVRADLHLADVAFDGPKGNLGKYVLDLAEQDPRAMGSSLVLKTDYLKVLDPHGRPERDEDGEPVPPIWMPTQLHASDIVCEGDAVHSGFLSLGIDGDKLPDSAVRMASATLNKLFADAPREVVRARMLAFIDRYLAGRYGQANATSNPDLLRRKLRLKELGRTF